jgi:hypothetical protein
MNKLNDLLFLNVKSKWLVGVCLILGILIGTILEGLAVLLYVAGYGIFAPIFLVNGPISFLVLFSWLIPMLNNILPIIIFLLTPLLYGFYALKLSNYKETSKRISVLKNIIIIHYSSFLIMLIIYSIIGGEKLENYFKVYTNLTSTFISFTFLFLAINIAAIIFAKYGGHDNR